MVPLVAHAGAAVVGQQDGIVARLETTPKEIVLGWRFTRRPSAPLARIEAKIDGRPTEAPQGYEPFPASGEIAVVTFLVDTGDPARAKLIDGTGRSVLEALKGLPSGVQARAATYDSTYHALDLASFAADAHLPPGDADAGSDLSKGLTGALDAMASAPASRRAVYVYTDGFNTDPRGLAKAKERALAEDVAVSFVLTPSSRLADVAALKDFAMATGGRLLRHEWEVGDDMVFLTSGGRVTFPYLAEHRFFWQSAAKAEVTLQYGDRRLSLSSPAALPPAGLGGTLDGLFNRSPFGVFVGMIAAVVVGVVLLVRRLRRSRAAASVSPLSAKPR